MISRVHDQLVIEDGPTIELQGRPPQGSRHEVLFGVATNTLEPVVIKLERIPGALQREQAALAWLSAQHGPVPRLVGGGTAAIKGERVTCLVMTRCPGASPATGEGWTRMGRAHAHLADLGRPASGLKVLDPITFGHQHAERVSGLAGRLAPLAESIRDWGDLISPVIPASAPLIITHGDPGPGNYLDDGERGTLIDWEHAHVAPRGLDLARLVFIALLGAGPDRYVAHDRLERASAAISGYLTASRDSWRPSDRESRWWTMVAGVQFVHQRWERGGQPAPWEDAARTLHTALSNNFVWSKD